MLVSVRNLPFTSSLSDREPLFKNYDPVLHGGVPQLHPAYVQYFDGSAQFLNRWGVDIEPDDNSSYNIETKALGLFYTREILRKSGRDPNRMR